MIGPMLVVTIQNRLLAGIQPGGWDGPWAYFAVACFCCQLLVGIAGITFHRFLFPLIASGGCFIGVRRHRSAGAKREQEESKRICQRSKHLPHYSGHIQG